MLRHSRVRLSGCLGDVRPLLLHTNTTARSYAQLAQAQVSAHARRPSKKEGTIEEVFTKLTTEGPPLPPRFADLKKEIVRENAMNNKEAIVQSWRAVLTELEGAMEEIAGRRNEVRILIEISAMVCGRLTMYLLDDFASIVSRC